MANIIDRHTIEKIIAGADIEVLIQYIEHAFISFSEKSAVVPPVGTLRFQSPPGDMHIKYGYIRGEPHYVVKIASGFYENPVLGLSSSNGLNLVFSQKTGVLETILLDEGFLTDIRTALAGAVVAKYMAPVSVTAIGIMGCGIQARLQLKYLKQVVPCKKVIVWGRSEERLLAYKEEMSKEGFDIEITTERVKVPKTCNLIVTTTPSESPLVFAEDLIKGTHITAVGADTKEKQELDAAILKNAHWIVVDNLKQCQAHGEIHKAFQSNQLKDKNLIELGQIIQGGPFKREEDDLTIADLTGIATQDIQISKFVLDHL